MKQHVVFRSGTQFCVIEVESVWKNSKRWDLARLGADRENWASQEKDFAYEVQVFLGAQQRFRCSFTSTVVYKG